MTRLSFWMSQGGLGSTPQFSIKLFHCFVLFALRIKISLIVNEYVTSNLFSKNRKKNTKFFHNPKSNEILYISLP